MMYYDFKAGEHEYKLRLTTRSTIMLEKALGCNPLMIFKDDEQLPPVTVMVQVLHASLQEYHHGMSMEKVYGVFDEYLADGNTPMDFVGEIIEVYKVSGIIPNDRGAEKN